MADITPNAPELAGKLPEPVFHDPIHHIKIYQGDCLEILAAIPPDCVDLIFADPPYFLSNDGITCHAGKMVSVGKGKWGCSHGADTHNLVSGGLTFPFGRFSCRIAPRKQFW
jgi:DNA modification methylase